MIRHEESTDYERRIRRIIALLSEALDEIHDLIRDSRADNPERGVTMRGALDTAYDRISDALAQLAGAKRVIPQPMPKESVS